MRREVTLPIVNGLPSENFTIRMDWHRAGGMNPSTAAARPASSMLIFMPLTIPLLSRSRLQYFGLQCIPLADESSWRGWLRRRQAATAGSPAGVGFAIGTYGMKPLPTTEALRTIAEIGYDGVELALMPGWPADPATLTAAGRKEIARALADTALELPALNESLPLKGTPANRAYNLERVKLAAEMAHVLSPAMPPCLDTILGLKTADWETAKNRMVDELHDWARSGSSGGDHHRSETACRAGARHAGEVHLADEPASQPANPADLRLQPYVRGRIQAGAESARDAALYGLH